MNRSLSTVILACLTLLAGCASTYKAQLTPQSRQELSSLYVVNHVVQPEIGSHHAVSFMPYNPQTGPLGMVLTTAIDGAVNAYRAKNAEAAAEQQRDKLLGYDFVSALSKTMQQALASLSWTTISHFQTITDAETIDVPQLISHHPNKGILVLGPSYAFSPKADAIYIDLTASLYRKSDVDQKNPLFSNNYRYQSAIHRPDAPFITPAEAAPMIAAIKAKYEAQVNEREYNESELKYFKKKMTKEIRRFKKQIIDSPQLADTSKQPWTAENLKTTLEIGAQQIANLLLLDLNDSRTAVDYEAAEDEVNVMVSASRESDTNIKLYPMGTFNGYNLYRHKSGKLFAVPIDQKIRFHSYPG